VSAGSDSEIAAQLLLFAEQTADFVGVADPWGHVIYLNPAARKRLGVADATDLTLADVFPLDEFAFYYDVARPQLLRTGAWSGEVRVTVAGEGAVKMYVSTTAKIGPGGEIDGLVVHAREVPGSFPVVVTNEAEVDEATGLLTRAAFEDRVHGSLTAVHRYGETRALVLVDVLGMTDAIATLGQPAAATIMRALAGRLTRLARTIDVAGRVGEDQLGLLLGAVRSHAEGLRIAEVIHTSLVDPPITTAAGEFVASVRCGVAVSKAGDDPVGLIGRAAAALSEEEANRETEIRSPSRVGERSAESATIDDFRVGLSHRDVQPYAQPVVELRSGDLVGYRGSARWHHRTLGTLEPGAFIDMVADTPLASQVDLYVAREMAAVLTLSVGESRLRMYTPVSRRLIADVHTEQYLAEIADAFFVSMDQIRLQIAVPLLDRWSPALQDAIESLRDAGVALVLTGVEHLSDAQEFAARPFDELDLSRRLTTAALTDPDAWVTVSDVVGLARDRAVAVTATGVDTTQHRDMLLAIGCDFASGQLYGAPAPADSID
jgi:diguanylate cyclase (GGDEF)-like protein